jgi:hypothetical protein
MRMFGSRPFWSACLLPSTTFPCLYLSSLRTSLPLSNVTTHLRIHSKYNRSQAPRAPWPFAARSDHVRFCSTCTNKDSNLYQFLKDEASTSRNGRTTRPSARPCFPRHPTRPPTRSPHCGRDHQAAMTMLHARRATHTHRATASRNTCASRNARA